MQICIRPKPLEVSNSKPAKLWGRPYNWDPGNQPAPPKHWNRQSSSKVTQKTLKVTFGVSSKVTQKWPKKWLFDPKNATIESSGHKVTVRVTFGSVWVTRKPLFSYFCATLFFSVFGTCWLFPRIATLQVLIAYTPARRLDSRPQLQS